MSDLTVTIPAAQFEGMKEAIRKMASHTRNLVLANRDLLVELDDTRLSLDMIVDAIHECGAAETHPLLGDVLYDLDLLEEEEEPASEETDA